MKTNILLLLLVTAAAPLFAQVPAQMQSAMDTVQEIFTGPIVRTLMVISLAGCAIGYGVFKDNEKMKRNVIAIGIACVIIMAASGIVGLIWSE